MVDLLIPSAEQMRAGLVQAAVRAAFGPGTYYCHIRTDLEPWMVAVIYPGQRQAITGTITPDQALSPDYRRALAQALCRQAARLGWLESR